MAPDVHPDFIITAGGKDVTAFCLKWDIHDSEKQSHLDVVLDNRDRRFDGAFQVGEMLAIRFGRWMNLQAKVELAIMKKGAHFGDDGLTCLLVGCDPTHKLQRKTGKGQQPGTQIKPNIDQIAKETGTQIDHSKIQDEGGKPADGDECARQPCLGGTTMAEHLQGVIDQAKSPKQDNSGGDTFSIGAGEGGDITSSGDTAVGIKPNDPSEKNRLDNASKRAKSEGIKARLRVIGLPQLRAKRCITIQNVGEWSGKWYVQSCHHSWSKGGGYTTSADLLRGKLGKDSGGGAAATQPMMFFGDIWKGPNAIYAGPRPSDSESQVTLTFGNGEYVMSFDPMQDALTGANTGNQATGTAINPNKASDPYEEVKSEDNKSGGSGSSGSTGGGGNGSGGAS